MKKKILKLFVAAAMTAVMTTTITVGLSVTNTVEAHAEDTQVSPVIEEAYKHLGKPYVYGQKGPNTFDCSGFTSYVYKTALGIDIGGWTGAQINSGVAVTRADLKPGDLVFPSSGHVGIYIGDGLMIHAPQPGDVVKISNVYSFYAARRIINKSSVENSLFDAKYYAYRYSDLAKAFGSDTKKLYEHYIKYGIKEGRSASPVFDPSYYLSKNPDVARAYGAKNYVGAYNHFVKCGYKENRETSPVFNISVYRQYSDLKKYDAAFLYNHFITNGMNEGRKASNNFIVSKYKSKYADLRRAYGNNMRYYFYHYLRYGIKEGRKAK